MENPFLQQVEFQILREDFAAALGYARMGLSLFPDDVELWGLAAFCAARQGDDDYVEQAWRHLMALQPLAVEPVNELALLLERRKRPVEAEALYRQALLAQPLEATFHTNLGLLLENLGRHAEALLAQRRALELAPDSAEILVNLAGVLVSAGEFAEAESRYRQAIAVQPDFAPAHANLGVLLSDLRRHDEAEIAFRESLRLAPDYALAQYNFGQFLLMHGHFAEAWPLHEGRLHDLSGMLPSALPAAQQWQGQSLAGKSIVVIPEQGLGDEIQFCRYLPWLKAQGAAKVTFVCRPALLALMQTLVGPDVVLSLSEAGPDLAEHDYWCFMLSLPRWAGTQLATIPAATPYLFADEAVVARLAPHFCGDGGRAGLRVGLVWRGNPRHQNDAERSFPDLSVMSPLWAVPGVRFFSLQVSEAPLHFPEHLPLLDLAPLIGDFADTAALLSQLDLLITVDTSVAHLAGALGVPCWVLLPWYKMDWRWLLGRDDSPWYPGVRLFRQPRHGDWAAVLDEVVAALGQWRPGKI